MSMFLFVILKPWKYIYFSSKYNKYLLLIIIVLALFLRVAQPFEYYIFSDESYYLAMAKNLSQGNRIFDTDVSLKKSGYEILLALPFVFTGQYRTEYGFMLNIFFGLMNIVLVFFLVRELWDEKSALASAFLIAILPEHIRWSTTVSLEIPALFFILASLLCFFIFIKKKNWLVLFLSLLLINYASFIRPEAIMVLGLEVLFLFYNINLLKLAWFNRVNMLTSLTIFAVSIWNIVFTWQSSLVWKNIWNTAGVKQAFSVNYFWPNLSSIFIYHFKIVDLIFFTVCLTGLIGFIALFVNKQKQKAIFLSAITLAFLFYYSIYFYGIADLTMSRFIAIWLTLSIILSGIGFEIMFRFAKERQLLTIFLVLFGLLFYLMINYEKLLPPTPQAWAIKEKKLLLSFEQANPSCLYLDTFPFESQFHGYQSIYPQSFFSDSNMADNFSCVFYIGTPPYDLLLFWKKMSYDLNIWQYQSGRSVNYTSIIPGTPD